jgi:Bacterial Ig-like domain
MDSQANHLRERRQLGAADRSRRHPIRSTILGVIAAALATIALVVVASGNNSAIAASSLVNGNFETGDLTGWSVDTTYDGNARAVPSFEYYVQTYCEPICYPEYMLPREGSSFALLTSAGQKPQVTSISQPFEASNGDKVSGWAFFRTYTDYYDLSVYGAGDDKAQVVITNDSGTTVATPFEDRVSWGNWRATYPGWSYWEHTFSGLTGTGQFRIEARLQAPGPNCTLYPYFEDGCTVMGLDDVKTSTGSPVPPPSDTTAPDTTITSGPNSPTNNTAPTFTFSGSDNVTATANLKYQYQLDSGGWSAASTSTTANLTGLSEGAHLFEVRAVDEAGNVDATPAHSSFTVDTTQPMVKSTTPSGVKRVARGTDLTASFSEKMEPSTVDATTFKLYKVNSDGTQTQITDVVVSLSSDGLTATLNPFGSKTTLLARSTKYEGVITTGTKDLAGNSLAQQMSWTFTTKS